MSESRSSSGTRPTLATQIRADSSAPPGMLIVTSARDAVGLVQQRQRELVGVEDRVGLLLPALAGQRLLEVAVPVHQPDAHQRDAEVAGRLQVVAGEDAETAGVLREDGGDAVLRGEVGDRARRVGAGLAVVPALAGQVAVQVVLGHPQHLEEAGVGAQLLEPGPADGAQEPDRVLPGGLPQRRRPRRGRRPASPGARTTAGCPPGRPAQPGSRAGQDGR